MRNIMRIFGVLCVCLFSSADLAAETIVLVSGDRDGTRLEMAAVRSIEIVDGKASGEKSSMTANLTNGGQVPNLCTVAFGDIDVPAGLSAKEGWEGIAIYPNPVSERLFISGAGDAPTIKIIDADGKVVMKSKGAEVTVGGLKSGVYIVFVNGKCARFVKK